MPSKFDPRREDDMHGWVMRPELRGAIVLEPRTAVVRLGVPRCPECDGVVIRGDDGPVCMLCAWAVWAL